MKFTPDDPLIWSVRTFIYEHFVATTAAPTVLTIVDRFALTVDEATAVLTALHEQHALFLVGIEVYLQQTVKRLALGALREKMIQPGIALQ